MLFAVRIEAVFESLVHTTMLYCNRYSVTRAFTGRSRATALRARVSCRSGFETHPYRLTVPTLFVPPRPFSPFLRHGLRLWPRR